MSTVTRIPSIDAAPARDAAGIGGHPRGLTTLFFTEFWERFSYYGMRAILVLYMAAPASQGGLEFDTAKATSIYGTYTMSVYLTSLPGGWLADRVFGARLAVLLGGITIALGHFAMAVDSMTFFYGGMILIAIGTGLLKPNISTMVGGLYGADDSRRDAGFSIFYMGINLGGMVAALVCGYLGQRVNYHVGFAAAGVGMVLGLIQYVAHRKRLESVGARRQVARAKTANALKEPLTAQEKKKLFVIGFLFLFSILFWTAFEQSGSSLNLFAARQTRNSIFGYEFPSSWLQSVNSFFILTLAPAFAWLWARWGKRQPSSPAKFSFALLSVGAGLIVIAIAGSLTGSGKVSPMWLVALYFIHTVGELCLSPVGLSTVTKLAPARMVGLMMGVWFLSIAIGNKLAGWAAGFYRDEASALFRLYAGLAAAALAGAVTLALLTPFIRRLIGRAD
ncbi:MAG TPA: peptide MFS transporter [Blastocatellia bacterium]|nr:peptide MFS transporter [Blastocatellia bacterium]